jgi:hypothetical protein
MECRIFLYLLGLSDEVVAARLLLAEQHDAVTPVSAETPAATWPACVQTRPRDQLYRDQLKLDIAQRDVYIQDMRDAIRRDDSLEPNEPAQSTNDSGPVRAPLISIGRSPWLNRSRDQIELELARAQSPVTKTQGSSAHSTITNAQRSNKVQIPMHKPQDPMLNTQSTRPRSQCP